MGWEEWAGEWRSYLGYGAGTAVQVRRWVVVFQGLQQLHAAVVLDAAARA